MCCVVVSVCFIARGQDAQAPEASPQDAESREAAEEGSSFPILYCAVFVRIGSSSVARLAGLQRKQRESRRYSSNRLWISAKLLPGSRGMRHLCERVLAAMRLCFATQAWPHVGCKSGVRVFMQASASCFRFGAHFVVL